jgi:regulatory protein
LDKEILYKLQRYCAYQDRCVWDVEQKMQELEIPAMHFKKYIDDLIEEKYIDNKRYIESYVRGHFFRKKWGRCKIREGLKIKKLDTLLIEEVIENEIPEDDYHQTLLQLLEKHPKAKTIKNPFEKKNKLYQYALQKGFESEEIWKILNKNLK